VLLRKPDHTPQQVSRFETLLRRLLSLKQSGILAGVSHELGAGLEVLPGDLAFELRHLQGISSFAFSTNAGPTVGQSNKFQLQNPAGSGIVVVVERIFLEEAIAVPSGGTKFLWLCDGAAASPIGPQFGFRDTRGTLLGLATTRSGAHFNTEVSAAPGLTLGTSVPVWRGASIDLQLNFLLMPGFSLVAAGTVNTSDRFAVAWFERPFEGSERR